MYLQKAISRKTFSKNYRLFFVGVLKVNDENSRTLIHQSEAWIGGSPDPDPYKNVMDPQHWLQQSWVLSQHPPT
jgi:hypothetical protein